MQASKDFEELRPLLLGVAYRMLGSMWDAEDVVQEAFVRWSQTERAAIEIPRAYLITVVTRLSLDVLKSARVKREAYVGPWLPEPVDTDSLGPMETATLRDTVSYATMHLLERLTPAERAVFVLREAFALPYDQIAPVVAASSASCRQMHHRARTRLAQPPARAGSRRAVRADLVREFLDAAQTGDLSALSALLSHDVIAYNDGGGRVRAALRPIKGRDKVVAFITGLLARFTLEQPEIVHVNGEVALSTIVDGRTQLVMLDIADGRIEQIFVVLNPDKQGHATTAKRVASG